jgi:hypothetical protein
VQEFADQLTAIGTTFTDTAARLGALPPPTIEGGDELAQQLIGNMQAAGPVFVDFGQRARTIAADDDAAGQQFLADLQSTVGGLDIAQFQPNAAARAAVAEVPSCSVLGT